MEGSVFIQTVEDYCVKFDKKIDTVLRWIYQQYIPGVAMIDGKILIPDDARLPYTERKLVEGYKMYKSFVKGYYKGKSITPQLMNLSEERFNSINNDLMQMGLISEERLCGVTYYNATPQGANFISMNNSSAMTFF